MPLALLVLALLLLRAVARVAHAHAAAPTRPTLRPRAARAFMMVLMMALHSQLEYPLWYAYFLLPTALAFGLCLAARRATRRRAAPARAPPARAGRWWSPRC